jgi:tetratricopeptide (TPR) repeat protein
VIKPCEQALALFQGLDEPDSWNACFALHSLGVAARYQGNYERAEALLEESLTMSRQGGRVEYSAEVLTSLGLVELEQGQHKRAHQALKESLMTARIWMPETTLEGLAGVAVGQEYPERAARLFGAAEAVHARMGTPSGPPIRTSTGDTSF